MTDLPILPQVVTVSFVGPRPTRRDRNQPSELA
jgi:hypothetical protein